MERSGKCYGNDMMKVWGTWLLALLGTVLSLASCSVKEDRAGCPCVLELDFAGPYVDGAGFADLLVSSEKGVVWKDTVDVDRNRTGYSVPVPRTRLHVRAWAGADGYVSDEGLRIPHGQDCPRVYMHDSDIIAEGETFVENVLLRKNHCVMTVVTEGEGKISAGLQIKGNIAGYDAVGRPLYGDFECPLEEIGLDEGYTVVLPRQTDASLMLMLDDGTGNHKAFALGQYIVSSGYDWTAADLEDVTVTLDYALTEIRMTINGWEGVYRYDMEI